MLPALNPRITAWQARRVWIVGGSSGIGAALGRALLARGARVALSARNGERLAQVAAGHSGALLVPFDASESADWRAASATVRAEFGDLDLAVFCAADYTPQRAFDIQADQVRATLATNLSSVYYGLEQVLPPMVAAARGGIVILASVAGYVGLPGAVVYGPSKAALINLAELLYCELHMRGIGVYLVNPGFVKTRLTDKNSFAMPSVLSPEQAADGVLRGLARGRFEIHFPYRFTLLLKLFTLLPRRLRFRALQRLVAA